MSEGSCWRGKDGVSRIDGCEAKPHSELPRMSKRQGGSRQYSAYDVGGVSHFERFFFLAVLGFGGSSPPPTFNRLFIDPPVDMLTDSRSPGAILTELRHDSLVVRFQTHFGQELVQHRDGFLGHFPPDRHPEMTF